MDGLRLPPLIEEVLDSSDELCELKDDKPAMLGETLTAKERESLEEKEEPVGDGEEKEVKEEKQEESVEELKAQMLQLLLELEEAREVSQKHEESFLEIQGLLEDERLASAHQAESFTRQIQRLQAQLRALQEEIDALEEEKESELEEAQEELRAAQEEVLMLQQAAEEAAGERENDIASLQEELCRLRAELQRLHGNTQEYELEITTLRAEIDMKSQSVHTHGDLSQLTQDFLSLRAEQQTLSSKNEELSNKLQQLHTCDDAYLAVTGEADSQAQEVKADAYISLTRSGPDDQEEVELKVLQEQLREAEEVAQAVQTQCDGLKGELQELQQLYDHSQSERAALELELKRCRAELQRLTGRKPQQADSEGWNMAVAAVAVAAIAVLVVPSFTRA